MGTRFSRPRGFRKNAKHTARSASAQAWLGFWSVDAGFNAASRQAFSGKAGCSGTSAQGQSTQRGIFPPAGLLEALQFQRLGPNGARFAWEVAASPNTFAHLMLSPPPFLAFLFVS